ncbi:MAG: VanZ family protein [Bacilli bacterium]|jgi:glycopeptide antibiotics resistance protein|nr:VanZ family protein [Bacilli bacterium]
MKKKYLPYLIILGLTLIYLFFFSGYMQMFTNLNSGIFGIVSSIIIYYYLYIIYLLYFKKYQLNKIELSLIFSSYLIISLYLLFFKNKIYIDSSTMDLIPLFFYHANSFEYTMMIGNILMFVPFGCLYQRFNLKISFFFIILLGLVIEGTQYIFKVGVFDLSDILLYTIGFYLGYLYFIIFKHHSLKYENLSYDIRLIITLMAILLIIALIIARLILK